MHYSRQTKVKGIDPLSFFEFLIIMSLLLRAGIERNLGPLPEDSFSSTDSAVEQSAIKDKFQLYIIISKVFKKKIDLIEAELSNFDIICLTETWLDYRTTDDTLALKGYNLYRHDRTGDNHGGICVFAKSNIFTRRRNDLELPDVECICIEVLTHQRKILISTFYRPP